MEADKALDQAASDGPTPKPLPLIETALAHAEDLPSDSLCLSSILELACLCSEAQLSDQAAHFLNRALHMANECANDFLRGSSLVSCAKALKRCGKSKEAERVLKEAEAVYRRGSPELFLRGLLMLLVVEKADWGQWQSALSLASSCPDADTRHEAVRLVILHMARRELWSEAVRVLKEHFSPADPAWGRAVITLAAVALEKGIPEAGQRAIIAQMAERVHKTSAFSQGNEQSANGR